MRSANPKRRASNGMGNMAQANMSECKDPQNRSRKCCCCGGHSMADAKKNKRHHGTAMRLAYRAGRQRKTR